MHIQDRADPLQLRDRGELAFIWEHDALRKWDGADALQSYVWGLLDGDVPEQQLPTVRFKWVEIDWQPSRSGFETRYVPVSIEGYGAMPFLPRTGANSSGRPMNWQAASLRHPLTDRVTS